MSALKVLIIDDEADIRNLLGRIIKLLVMLNAKQTESFMLACVGGTQGPGSIFMGQLKLISVTLKLICHCFAQEFVCGACVLKRFAMSRNSI